MPYYINDPKRDHHSDNHPCIFLPISKLYIRRKVACASSSSTPLLSPPKFASSVGAQPIICNFHYPCKSNEVEIVIVVIVVVWCGCPLVRAGCPQQYGSTRLVRAACPQQHGSTRSVQVGLQQRGNTGLVNSMEALVRCRLAACSSVETLGWCGLAARSSMQALWQPAAAGKNSFGAGCAAAWKHRIEA